MPVSVIEANRLLSLTSTPVMNIYEIMIHSLVQEITVLIATFIFLIIYLTFISLGISDFGVILVRIISIILFIGIIFRFLL